MRDDVESLIDHLRHHKNDRDYFYEIRSWDRDTSYQNRSPIEKASRLIYLNKACYNGLYRVNSSGEFNVPFGEYKNPNLCDEPNLRACARALRHVDIRVADYWDMLDLIKKEDFVYLDPPYEPVSSSSSFSSYTENGFDEVDQVKLFKFCQALSRKKAYFLLSNSAASWVTSLYKKDERFYVGKVKASRLPRSTI